MRTSDQINELAAALAKAQGAFEVPKKSHHANVATKSGGTYTYAYSTLQELIEATRPALVANGIAVLFDVTSLADGFVRVSTLLTHSSGQWWASDPIALPSGGTPQGAGSAATYGRRYSLSAALNVAAEDDDDAQQAQAAAQVPPRRTAAPSPLGGATAPPAAATSPASSPRPPTVSNVTPAKISEAQRKRLFAISKEQGWKDAEVKALLQRVLHVDSSKDIPTHRYKEIVKMLEAGVDSMGANP